MIDTKQFRDALGEFATGVCIATTAPPQGDAIGMTINSFSSVSLEPPLVLWSIHNSSDCFQKFNDSEVFSISVLSQAQEALSNHFAKPGDHTLTPEHFIASEFAAPVLKDAMATFECRVWAKYAGGDHTIMVGEVLRFGATHGLSPLLFHGGGYGRKA
ncbi:flavin reductase family protein [Halioxenophilus aromaticivorans]|uniref:Flavin reductase like domain-containing protein n=1 Tax=Halioxenophilus aromaticivorans TaxID=1306992 RepID=A0AAV3TZ20_9ALTE